MVLLEEQVAKQSEMLGDLHRALLEPPVGSKRPPLIEEMREAVSFYKGGKITTRAVLWALPAVAGAVAAAKYLKDTFS